MAWGPDQTARAWTELMRRLGYTKFVAQGGDVGAIVTSMLGQQAPPELLGIHSNFPYVVPPAVGKALRCGDPPSPSFSADEKRAYEQLLRFNTLHFAYGFENRTRPQTLYGLTDPIGLAAWLLDHGDGWGQPAPVQFVGHPRAAGRWTFRRRLHTRRLARQLHALLLDEYGHLVMSLLLVHQGLRNQHQRTGCH